MPSNRSQWRYSTISKRSCDWYPHWNSAILFRWPSDCGVSIPLLASHFPFITAVCQFVVKYYLLTYLLIMNLLNTIFYGKLPPNEVGLKSICTDTTGYHYLCRSIFGMAIWTDKVISILLRFLEGTYNWLASRTTFACNTTLSEHQIYLYRERKIANFVNTFAPIDL
jgi:hypothetical protein